MTLLSSDRKLLAIIVYYATYYYPAYIPLKNTPQIQETIGSIFEVYFDWYSKTRPCIFRYRAKYKAKYSYVWYFTTGLRVPIWWVAKIELIRLYKNMQKDS